MAGTSSDAPTHAQDLTHTQGPTDRDPQARQAGTPQRSRETWPRVGLGYVVQHRTRGVACRWPQISGFRKLWHCASTESSCPCFHFDRTGSLLLSSVAARPSGFNLSLSPPASPAGPRVHCSGPWVPGHGKGPWGKCPSSSCHSPHAGHTQTSWVADLVDSGLFGKGWSVGGSSGVIRRARSIVGPLPPHPYPGGPGHHTSLSSMLSLLLGTTSGRRWGERVSLLGLGSHLGWRRKKR